MTLTAKQQGDKLYRQRNKAKIAAAMALQRKIYQERNAGKPKGEGVKVCSKCKQELSLDKFSRNRSTVDGCDSYCKACRVVAQKLYKALKEGRTE